MKDMYQVTRPTWAELGRSETVVIFIASLLVGLYGGLGPILGIRVLKGVGLSRDAAEALWIPADVLITTLACLALIRGYQLLKVRSYPSIFLYCFSLPEEFNSTMRSQIVGYCLIIPNRENGDFRVEGASFDWDDGELNVASCVTYRSTQVRGIEDGGDTRCQIRLDIEKKDLGKRRYRGGLLEFKLAKTVRDQKRKRIDLYAGYFTSAQGDSGKSDLEVRSKGIAEWFCRGSSDEYDMAFVLKERAETMFERLDTLLSTRPLPKLWQYEDDDDNVYVNLWNSPIPTPQEVILSPRLRPYIDRFLDGVLGLSGVSREEIEKFKAFARSRARLAERTRSYEGRLKRGLAGRTRDFVKLDALVKRAELIRDQIQPFLAGNSLLDIGCGNGLIADKIRNRFSQIKLLDVVDYVPKHLNLPFEKYKEGEDLPVGGNSFGTVLLLNVLHHSKDPIRLLKSAWAATDQRLIVIESVVGVHQAQPSAKYELLDASDDEQIAYAAFVDWFYNRVLHDDIPVPYNFTKPEQWISIFNENGMRVSKVIHLGQDIDIGPEYHVLFVLEREAKGETGPRLVAKSTKDAA